MSSYNDALGPGDPIFQPQFGFGTVNSQARRDRVQPIHKAATADADPTEDYYYIHLAGGATLLVPVQRADLVGLRRLTNTVDKVRDNLRCPAEGLPADFRQRAALLRIREQLPEPSALAYSVRDLLAQGRNRNLSAGQKKWLDKSCQRLSTEAAIVDRIPMFVARAAILAVVRELGAG